jgi:ABC-2 type transport system permease protein
MSTVASRIQLVSLIRVLALSEFRLRFAGSALGYLWSLGKPLLLFTVLYVVFSQMLRLGAGQPDYPLYLLLGVIIWSFFAEATGTAVRVLVSNADVLRKVSFPYMALPVAASLTSVLILLLNMVVFIGFLLVTGHLPTLSWLWFPLLLVELYLVTLGVSLLLASLFVQFRDVGQIWEVLVQGLFYATPIIYTLALVPDTAERILLSNPVAQVVVMARYVTISPDDGIGPLAGPWLAVPLAVAAGLLVLGVLVFRGTSRTMVERL